MTHPAHEIEVVDYDPRWPEAFGAYAATLRSALGDLVMSIEHVGSTSVVGLAAKPIIDIDVVISSRLLLKDVISTLAELHYAHEGNLGLPGREAFRWPQGRRHHLYVCSVDTPNLHNHLVFRDYLRRHPEAGRGLQRLEKAAGAAAPGRPGRLQRVENGVYRERIGESGARLRLSHLPAVS